MKIPTKKDRPLLTQVVLLLYFCVSKRPSNTLNGRYYSDSISPLVENMDKGANLYTGFNRRLVCFSVAIVKMFNFLKKCREN